MQISKFFTGIGILALGVTLVAGADEDNPAQAAARAALDAKLSQMNGMSPTTNMMSAPANSSSSANFENKAAPANSSAPISYQWYKTNNSSATLTNTMPISGYTQNREWKKTKSPGVEKYKMESSPMISTNAPSNSSGAQQFAPIVAPALPISGTKEERLEALDAKYKADQISPKDYFQQREEILKGR